MQPNFNNSSTGGQCALNGNNSNRVSVCSCTNSGDDLCSLLIDDEDEDDDDEDGPVNDLSLVFICA